MAGYFLDIEIETLQHVPVKFRIQIDETTRNQLLKLTPINVKLVHTLDPVKYPAAKIIAPEYDPLKLLKIDG